jgi:hypothetical protein
MGISGASGRPIGWFQKGRPQQKFKRKFAYHEEV